MSLCDSNFRYMNQLRRTILRSDSKVGIKTFPILPSAKLLTQIEPITGVSPSFLQFLGAVAAHERSNRCVDP